VFKSRRASQGEEATQLQGETRWWLSARFPLLDSQNRVYSVCTVSQDVSERVRHEQELVLFRQTLSDATDGIIIFSGSAENGFRVSYCSGRLSRDRASRPTPRPARRWERCWSAC
jgi:PAS domain-containing protein